MLCTLSCAVHYSHRDSEDLSVSMTLKMASIATQYSIVRMYHDMSFLMKSPAVGFLGRS